MSLTEPFKHKTPPKTAIQHYLLARINQVGNLFKKKKKILLKS